MTVAPSALLRCPACGGALAADPSAENGPTGGDGRLVCAGCARAFPVVRGIPRFVPAPAGYAESFGIQWTRYEVQRPDEDRAIFLAKTGFDPDTLAGRLVLDAGCGSGRYAGVAARLGARVFAVDVTQAVERAREVCADLPTVQVVQADILRLPFAPATFDAIYSIGVLHHTADTRAAFDALVRLLRPGGRLAVWIYRRTTRLQETVNSGLRAMTTRLPDRALHRLATAGAVLGGVPIFRHLNLLVPFSSHPDRHVRVCDTYDWYAPRYQHHHSEAEVVGWFRVHGFQDVRTLRGYSPRGAWYDRCQARGLIPGSGVNVVGRRPG
jgi:SAM-dependent methyltransferase